jgi:hypothetical protein
MRWLRRTASYVTLAINYPAAVIGAQPSRVPEFPREYNIYICIANVDVKATHQGCSQAMIELRYCLVSEMYLRFDDQLHAMVPAHAHVYSMRCTGAVEHSCAGAARCSTDRVSTFRQIKHSSSHRVSITQSRSSIAIQSEPKQGWIHQQESNCTDIFWIFTKFLTSAHDDFVILPAAHRELIATGAHKSLRRIHAANVRNGDQKRSEHSCNTVHADCSRVAAPNSGIERVRN